MLYPYTSRHSSETRPDSCVKGSGFGHDNRVTRLSGRRSPEVSSVTVFYLGSWSPGTFVDSQVRGGVSLEDKVLTPVVDHINRSVDYN